MILEHFLERWGPESDQLLGGPPGHSKAPLVNMFGQEPEKSEANFGFPTPSVGLFKEKNRQMCFSPRGSVWNVEGRVLLSISLGLAVRTFWSDLEKCPKSASGKIWGRHFGLGTFLM